MSHDLAFRFARDGEFEAPLRLVAFAANAESRNSRFPRVLEAPGPFAVVGSDPRCDIVFIDSGLSPRHAYFQALGAKVLCLDLGGTGGIISGAGACSAAWIDERHGVQFGDVIVALAPKTSLGETDAFSPRLPDFPATEVIDDRPLFSQPLPRVHLLFRSGDVQTEWRVRRPITLLGRAPECAVRLKGPGVSSFHAALVLTPAGLWVIELLSAIEHRDRAGIEINGRCVRFGLLGLADVLTIDRFRVKPRYSSSARPGKVVSSTDGTDSRRLALGADDVESRRAFDGRLSALVASQSAEIESLRREVEDLRDWVEEFRDRLQRLESRRNSNGSVRGGRPSKTRKRPSLEPMTDSADQRTGSEEPAHGLSHTPRAGRRVPVRRHRNTHRSP